MMQPDDPGLDAKVSKRVILGRDTLVPIGVIAAIVASAMLISHRVGEGVAVQAAQGAELVRLSGRVDRFEASVMAMAVSIARIEEIVLRLDPQRRQR